MRVSWPPNGGIGGEQRARAQYRDAKSGDDLFHGVDPHFSKHG